MIPLDKQLHFLGCFAIVAAVHLLSGNVWVGASVAIAVGAVKEVVDSKNPLNNFSWGDMIANFAGILAYLLFFYLGHYLHQAV